MLGFIKKHLALIIIIVAGVAVLTVAFFAGGKLSKQPNDVLPDQSKTSSAVSSTESTDIQSSAPTENPTASKKDNKKKDEKEKPTQNASKAEKKDNNSSKNTSSKISQKSDSAKNQTSKNNSSKSNKNNTVSSKPQKDKYQTDPIPEGKPKPVEPQEQEIEATTYSCTFSISCSTILDNMSMLRDNKEELVPKDGWLLEPQTVTFSKGESVFDVLTRVCKENNIHMEYSWTPIYNSAYIEGIGNLYEFDCGGQSGWMYCVNSWFPNYGCSRYKIQNGDVVEWKYTCALGYDIGGGYAVGE